MSFISSISFSRPSFSLNSYLRSSKSFSMNVSELLSPSYSYSSYLDNYSWSSNDSVRRFCTRSSISGFACQSLWKKDLSLGFGEGPLLTMLKDTGMLFFEEELTSANYLIKENLLPPWLLSLDIICTYFFDKSFTLNF